MATMKRYPAVNDTGSETDEAVPALTISSGQDVDSSFRTTLKFDLQHDGMTNIDVTVTSFHCVRRNVNAGAFLVHRGASP